MAQKGTVEINPTERVMVIFCYFLCLLFGFSTSTLFGYHMYLVLTNKTTLGRCPCVLSLRDEGWSLVRP